MEFDVDVLRPTRHLATALTALFTWSQATACSEAATAGRHMMSCRPMQRPSSAATRTRRSSLRTPPRSALGSRAPTFLCGKVVAIHSASALHFNTAWATYFATHLSYLNLLHRLPLFEIDLVSLYRAKPEMLALALGSQILHNTSLILRAAPRSVFGDCGVDFERWYPPHRQLLDGLSFLRFTKHHPHHFSRALDVVRDRFGVRCGPLPHVARASASN